MYSATERIVVSSFKITKGVIVPHLARGAIPLALPNSCPCILTGIPLFPAAIEAV